MSNRRNDRDLRPRSSTTRRDRNLPGRRSGRDETMARQPGQAVRDASRRCRRHVVAGSVTSWEQQLTIGLLALGKESWVSHEAAAQLLGLDRSKTERVEFMVLRGAKGRRLPFIVHSTHALPLIDRVTVNGLRCTSAHPNDHRSGSGTNLSAPAGSRDRQCGSPGLVGAECDRCSARCDARPRALGGATARSAPRRLWRAHDARARILEARPQRGTSSTANSSDPPRRRANHRQGRLLVGSVRRGRGGHGPAWSQCAGRPRPRRTAPRRAPGPRPKGVRIHLESRQEAARLRRADAHAATSPGGLASLILKVRETTSLWRKART